MRQITLTLLCCLLALTVYAQGGKQQLTLQEVVTGQFLVHNIYGVIPIPGDGGHYSQMNAEGTQIIKYSYQTGQQVEVLFDVATARECPFKRFDSYSFAPDGSKLLIATETTPVYRRSYTAVHYLYSLKRNSEGKINNVVERLSDGGPQQVPVFSPDGNMVAFVRDNNIFLVKLLYGNSERFNNWVDVNNYRGVYKMTEYIISKGHSKIAYMGMDFHAHYVAQRKQGFLDAMRAAGLEVPPGYVVSADNSEQAGFDACVRLLAAAEPTAIVCATDLIAVGCIHALQRRNVKIPAQIAVSGFDGFGIENTVFPKLTTVRQPLYDVGIRLADAVVDSINGRPLKHGIYIEPEIKAGESV